MTLTPRERNQAHAKKAWSRGFTIGVLTGALIVAVFVIGQRDAYAATRPAPHAEMPARGGTSYQGIKILVYPRGLPPHWRQWLKTCRAEQPKPGTEGAARWSNVWWKNTTNYTYKGGCGFTQLNWDRHKRKGQPRYMSDASPAEQLWACWRIYSFYAKIGGPGYGASVWDANKSIGFYGFEPDAGHTHANIG